MKKQHRTMIGILFILVTLLFPVVSADSQYQCYDFDPQIYGKSVQAAVSSDGQFIAVAGPDSGIISLFSANGTPLWGIRTNENITSIAISADGRSVIAGSYLGTIYRFDSIGNLLWNHSGLGCNNRITISGNGLNGFVFNDGKKGEPGSKTVFSYDHNGTILSERSVHQISDGAITSDGKYAVVGTKGNYGNDVIQLSGTGDVLWTDTIPDGWKIYGVAISDDGNFIAAVKDDGIYLYNRHGKILWNITPKYLTRSIAISPGGEYIAAGMQYKILYLNRNGTQLWDFTLDDYIYHLAISQNGQNIVAASTDMVYYLDRNGTCLWKYPLNDTVDSLSMSHDGRIVAVGSYRDTFTIFDKTGNSTTVNIKTIPVKPIGTPGPVPVKYPETNQQSYPASPTRKSALPDAIVFIAIITVGSLYNDQTQTNYDSADAQVKYQHSNWYTGDVWTAQSDHTNPQIPRDTQPSASVERADAVAIALNDSEVRDYLRNGYSLGNVGPLCYERSMSNQKIYKLCFTGVEFYTPEVFLVVYVDIKKGEVNKTTAMPNRNPVVPENSSVGVP